MSRAAKRDRLLKMRLEGKPYSEIGQEIGVPRVPDSGTLHRVRKRAQQLLSPPAAVRNIVVGRANGLCEKCGVQVGMSGQVHHKASQGLDCDQYHDLDNLALLCIGCHRLVHGGFLPKVANQPMKDGGVGAPCEGVLTAWDDPTVIPLDQVPAVLGRVEAFRGALWARLLTAAQPSAPAEAHPRDFLTVADVAARLNITKARTYGLIRAGELPCTTVGRYRRVDPAALDRWLAGQGAG